MTTPTRGMVLGKFMPPHLGHQYLFEFAREYVDELAIVVETERNQPIPGELRYSWVKEMFPTVNVLHLTDENPQDPSEYPDFWTIWRNSLLRLLPFTPDYVFASENYGWKLA
ncbi:MAG: adenylyltransferase/cytidyltransferase family protein, partial [Planctomycetaceae bacterium]|nr:adenylyltransferase/cytidyltransferase family protein [Planctomycetaceae bacterium]